MGERGPQTRGPREIADFVGWEMQGREMGCMGAEDPSAIRNHSSTYVIRVGGVLDARWTHWFEGLTLSAGHTETTIAGPVRDLAELHALLTRIHDLGLALLELRRVGEDHATDRRRSR